MKTLPSNHTSFSDLSESIVHEINKHLDVKSTSKLSGVSKDLRSQFGDVNIAVTDFKTYCPKSAYYEFLNPAAGFLLPPSRLNPMCLDILLEHHSLFKKHLNALNIDYQSFGESLETRDYVGELLSVYNNVSLALDLNANIEYPHLFQALQSGTFQTLSITLDIARYSDNSATTIFDLLPKLNITHLKVDARILPQREHAMLLESIEKMVDLKSFYLIANSYVPEFRIRHEKLEKLTVDFHEYRYVRRVELNDLPSLTSLSIPTWGEQWILPPQKLKSIAIRKLTDTHVLRFLFDIDSKFETLDLGQTHLTSRLFDPLLKNWILFFKQRNKLKTLGIGHTFISMLTPMRYANLEEVRLRVQLPMWANFFYGLPKTHQKVLDDVSTFVSISKTRRFLIYVYPPNGSCGDLGFLKLLIMSLLSGNVENLNIEFTTGKCLFKDLKSAFIDALKPFKNSKARINGYTVSRVINDLIGLDYQYRHDYLPGVMCPGCFLYI
jgi:hypothetical protein